jgi:hypothetical protein
MKRAWIILAALLLVVMVVGVAAGPALAGRGERGGRAGERGGADPDRGGLGGPREGGVGTQGPSDPVVE